MFQLLGATEWSAAIKAGNHSRIYSKVNANTGEMKGNIRPYNEYFLVNCVIKSFHNMCCTPWHLYYK